MQIWRTALQIPATFMCSNDLLKYLHTYVGKYYAIGQIRNAFDARIGTPEADAYIKALKEVCVSASGMSEEISKYFMFPLHSLVLGAWKWLTREREEGDVLILPFKQIATSGAYGDDVLGTQLSNYIIAEILIQTGDEA